MNTLDWLLQASHRRALAISSIAWDFATSNTAHAYGPTPEKIDKTIEIAATPAAVSALTGLPFGITIGEAGTHVFVTDWSRDVVSRMDAGKSTITAEAKIGRSLAHSIAAATGSSSPIAKMERSACSMRR